MTITNQGETEKYFDIRDGRLMVSLGPLSKKKYCTYSCSFCYLHSKDFLPYIGLEIKDIIDWIDDRQDLFDIIYVSGDTDSFAPPRTDKGIDLLYELTKYKKDLLFTTRAIFDDNQISKLSEIKKKQDLNNNLFIACISISQLNHPHLEPKPVPTPQERIKLLRRLKNHGIVTILALRPFLPIIPFEDYRIIIDQTKEYIDLVLGSVWYADKNGLLEKKVLSGVKESTKYEFTEERMDFDINEALWKVYKPNNLIDQISIYCSEIRVPFFMRSSPAITLLKSQFNISV